MSSSVFEIMTIGNELLIGKTLNTNAHWLAKRITELGGSVRRSTTIRDDLDEISDALKDALMRGASWVVICGGLGPTYDDKTLEGVAKSLDRELVLDRLATNMVRENYDKMVESGVLKEATLTPARLKMATIPSGSQPLKNPVGTAPGVLIKEGSSTIICLPGVPSEMKAIFEGSVVSFIRSALGKIESYEATFFVHGIVESDLAPILEKVVKDHPRVYVKSHPKSITEGLSRIDVHISASAEAGWKAKSLVQETVKLVMREVSDLGGHIEEGFV